MFSKSKWNSLSEQQRYKKLAEKGRELLLLYLGEKDIENHWHVLQTLILWSSIIVSLPELFDAVWLSNMVHEWQVKAAWNVSEPNLLVLEGDREAPIWPEGKWDVYLDNFRSAHNIGSIIRCMEAFRLGSSVFIPNEGVYNKCKIKKTAMGAESYINVQVRDPDSFIRFCTRPLVVIETVEQACSINDWSPSFGGSVVMGNEENGCSQIFIQQADIIIYIPTGGIKRSINVSNAFAIIAHHIANRASKK